MMDSDSDDDDDDDADDAKKGLRSTCTSLMSHTCATSRMMVARVAGNRSTVNVQVQEETCQVQVRVHLQDGCSSFRKPRRTDSKSNYLSSWQTQNHMYFKDSMYAMQCLFRRFYQKKMSTFHPRRLSFWISLWFHVPLEVAVALSSDRWPLRKAKKRAPSSRMAWRRLGENFRWKFVKMWSTVNNGFGSSNFAPIRSVPPSPCSLYIEGSNLLFVFEFFITTLIALEFYPCW